MMQEPKKELLGEKIWFYRGGSKNRDFKTNKYSCIIKISLDRIALLLLIQDPFNQAWMNPAVPWQLRFFCPNFLWDQWHENPLWGQKFSLWDQNFPARSKIPENLGIRTARVPGFFLACLQPPPDIQFPHNQIVHIHAT